MVNIQLKFFVGCKNAHHRAAFKNVGLALLGGLEGFVGNFVAHLKNGFVAWLSGALTAIKMPEEFNLMGVLSIARQVLGLTWDYLREKAANIIGEENVERLESVFEQLQTLIAGGWEGLLEQIKESFNGLKEQIFAKIQEFILVSVLKKAVLKLAGLFSPVGAVVQLVLTLWDVFQALREQFSRLMGVVTSVVEALGEIVAGRIDPAKQKIEDVLAALIPVAIGLFARLVGLGGLGRKVQEFIEAIRGRIERAVRRLILKIKARVQRMMRRRRGRRRGDRDTQNARPEEAHEETSPEDERTHRRFAGEAKAVLEAPPEQSGDVIDFAGLLRQKRAEADRLEQRYDRRLENPVRMTIAIDQSQAVRERQIIPFEVRVAPNDTEKTGSIVLVNAPGSPDNRLAEFQTRSIFAVRTLRDDDKVFQHPENDTKFSRTSPRPWKQRQYTEFFTELDLSTAQWNMDKRRALDRSNWFHVGSSNSQRYTHGEDVPSGVSWVRFVGEEESASDAEKIKVYKDILKPSRVGTAQYPDKSIAADDYRRQMRAKIVAAYNGAANLKDLDQDVLSARVAPTQYNRVIGQIFEEWVVANYGVRRDPIPILKSPLLGQDVWADGYDGTTLVEIKAISTPRSPNSNEREQMERYALILNREIKWLNPTSSGVNAIVFSAIRYQFNNESVAKEWLDSIKKLINISAKQYGERIITEG